MNLQEFIKPLSINIALLLAATSIFNVISRKIGSLFYMQKILLGLFFGLLSMACMLLPIKIAEGIIFDMRIIAVGIGALYGGIITGLISIIIPVVYRMYLGGIGTVTGIYIIITAGLIGSILHKVFKTKNYAPRPIWQFIVCGELIAVTALLLTFTLPREVNPVAIIKRIALSVLLLYPTGALLLGFLISREIITLANINKIKEDELHYRGLFNNTPISLWEQDFTEIKVYIDNVKKTKNITDIERYLQENPDFITECAGRIILNDVNSTTLKLYHAKSKQELFQRFPETFTPVTIEISRKGIIAIWNNEYELSVEGQLKTLDGTVKDAIFNITIPEGFRKDYSKVIVSILDITERKRQEEQLKSALMERELLIKEIHHRVKNNLSIINSLLEFEGTKSGKEQIISIQNKINSIALLHNNLYRSNTINTINFRTYCTDLIENVKKSFEMPENSVKYRLDIENYYLNIETTLPCGLILTELISNSLKYAFPGRNNNIITIDSFIDEKSNCVLTYSDNGIGIKKDIDWQTSDSLGFYIIKALTMQLEGEIIKNDTSGVSFTFKFSVKEEGISTNTLKYHSYG